MSTTVQKVQGKVLDVSIHISIPDADITAVNGTYIYPITSNNIVSFNYINVINGFPSGNFVITDPDTQEYKFIAGYEGFIQFINTGTGDNEKYSFIPFIINNSERKIADSKSIYTITWEFNTHQLNKIKTISVKGNSIDAIQNICEQFEFGGSTVIFPSDVKEIPADNMKRILPFTNFKEALKTVIDKSYLKNDYLYFYVDDVNNGGKISSLNTNDGTEPNIVFVPDISTDSNLEHIITHVNKPSVDLWSYQVSSYTPSDNTGKNRDKLFPSVILSENVNGDAVTASCGDFCFSDLIKAGGDNKQEAIAKKLNLKLPYACKTSESIRHVRQYANNTHKMYSVAGTFRDYKLATYGKTLVIKMKNTIGPALGSKCGIIVNASSNTSDGTSLYYIDYTGYYVLKSKYITYDASTIEITKTQKGFTEFTTTLEFISDNITNEDFTDLLAYYKKILEAKK